MSSVCEYSQSIVHIVVVSLQPLIASKLIS